MNCSNWTKTEQERLLKCIEKLKDIDPEKYQQSLETFNKKLQTNDEHGIEKSAEQAKAELLNYSSSVKCPKCNSISISTNRRGWKLTTGFLGSSKMINTCQACGYQWKPKI